MNTRKFTGDMSSQVEDDRDELVALRAKCERLEGDRDHNFHLACEAQSHQATLLAVIEQCEKALESALAGVWDGHYSGKGVVVEYAQAVDREVKDALAAIKKVREQ